MQGLQHVYSLPLELLNSLTPRNLFDQPPERPSTPEAKLSTNAISGTRGCNICLGSTFAAVEEQRAHFRSDWHRYNVRMRLKGGNPVFEADFGELIDGLEDSLSGSVSSDDEDDSSGVDAVSTLVNKTKRLARSPSPSLGSHKGPQTALAWFHSRPSTQIGVYKALFPAGLDPTHYLSELKAMQSRIDEGRTWAVFMVAGGHFAGAVVRVSRPEDEPEDLSQKKSKKPQKPKPDIEVLQHKTFHRYTTRRKQGGSQSTNDNSKGNAKSAGAQLRRYGEQALRDDIRGLIEDWMPEINDCERIWIRASGNNRKIFMDYDGAIISKEDKRLRTFPFPTRRPTQSELSRCLLELTRVKVSHLTEDELRAQDEAYIASLPKPKPTPDISIPPENEKLKPVKLTKEEEILREKWARLLEMVIKGRLEPLKGFWEREGSNLGGVNVRIPEWTGERRLTLLQLAAQSGQHEVTQWLLEVAHADPTIPAPVAKTGEVDETDAGHESDGTPRSERAHKTAYDLAKSKEVRDAFRRCAATNPDWWDWFGVARVPSALSKEMEEERDEKKKVRRKGLKDRVKEREAKEREKEKEQPMVVLEVQAPREVKNVDPLAPRRLGGASGGTQGVAGLTPEMRAKVERERRARAAEARLKGLNAG